MEAELMGMLPCKRIAAQGELLLCVQPCACLRCHTLDQTNQPLGAGNWQWNHRTSSLAALKLSWGLLLTHQATEIQKCQRWRETFQGRIRNQRSRWTWSVSLFSQMHQEHTFRQTSACRTAAESGQEYPTSEREYIEPHKTQGHALSL